MIVVLGVLVLTIDRGACVFPFLGLGLKNLYGVSYGVLNTLSANILESTARGVLEGSVTRSVDDVSYGH